MDEYLKANKDTWNAWTPVHVGSKFYDVESFKAGGCSLAETEIHEVGGVMGKSLLHLQCHFGQDTLSWARRGAKVTGADFSDKAIAAARALAGEVGVDAEFVCCDLYDLPRNLSGEFDVVYTGGGVLTWLPDIENWAKIVAHYLKPGGVFYIREFHPTGCMFDDESDTPRLRYPYFYEEKPLRFSGNGGSYTDGNSGVDTVTYEWSHTLGDIVTALIGAGLSIEYLHEFAYCTYQSHPFLKQGEDGLWRDESLRGGLPLMFSIKAVK